MRLCGCACCCLTLRLLLLLLIICTLISLTASKQVTWIPDTGGSIHNAGNWLGGVIPDIHDDVVFDIHSTASTQDKASPAWAQASSPSFTAMSLENIDPAMMLTLSAPWHINSLSVSGDAALIVDQPVIIREILTIGEHAQVRVRNAELVAAHIAVHGLLALELASVSASTAAAAASTSELEIFPASLLLTSGPGGSNHLRHWLLTVHGGTFYMATGPLLLDHTIIHNTEQGLIIMHNELLSTENGDDAESRLVNAGQMIITNDDDGSLSNNGGGQRQMISMHIYNQDAGSILITSSSSPDAAASSSSSYSSSSYAYPQSFSAVVSFMQPVLSAGWIIVSQHRQMHLSASLKLLPSSTLQLNDSSSLHLLSASLLNQGVIKSALDSNDAELWIHSQFNHTGTMQMNRVILRAGGLLTLSAKAMTHILQFNWQGGMLLGLDDRATMTVYQCHVEDGSIVKMMAAIKLIVAEEMKMLHSTTLILQHNAQLNIEGIATLLMAYDTRLQADNDAGQLLIGERANMRIHTGAATDLVRSSSDNADGDDETEHTTHRTVIAIPVTCHGNVTVFGTGTALFSASSTIQHLHAVEAATIHLQGPTPHTVFLFHDALDLAQTGQTVLLENARVQLASSALSSIHTLTLFSGEWVLAEEGPLSVDVLTIGSSTSSALLTGNAAIIQVQHCLFAGGTIRLGILHVLHSLTARHPSQAKLLDVHNVTLISGSHSSILSTLSISVHTFILIQSRSTLTVGPGVMLYTEHHNHTTDVEDADAAILMIGGVLVCEGHGGVSSTSIRIQVWNDDGGEWLIHNQQAATGGGLYTLLLDGGVTSTANSLLHIQDSAAAVSLSCPEAFHCQYGKVQGAGHMEIVLGQHTYLSAVGIRQFTIQGGSVRWLSDVLVHSLSMILGQLIIHRVVNVSHLHWSGGMIQGYPLLSSVLYITPADAAADSDDQLSTKTGTVLLDHQHPVVLQGMVIFLHSSTLIWTGVGMMLWNDALLYTDSRSVVTIQSQPPSSGDTEITAHAAATATACEILTGTSSSRWIHAGHMVVTSSSLPFILHLPLINTGTITIQSAHTLTMLSDYIQSATTSVLDIHRQAVLHKANSDLMIAQGTVKLSGRIVGNVELAGHLLVLGDAAEDSTRAPITPSQPEQQPWIQGDLLMTDTASYAPCDIRQCRTLPVNGSIYVAGDLQMHGGAVIMDSIGSIMQSVPAQLFGSFSLLHGRRAPAGQVEYREDGNIVWMGKQQTISAFQTEPFLSQQNATSKEDVQRHLLFLPYLTNSLDSMTLVTEQASNSNADQQRGQQQNNSRDTHDTFLTYDRPRVGVFGLSETGGLVLFVLIVCIAMISIAIAVYASRKLYLYHHHHHHHPKPQLSNGPSACIDEEKEHSSPHRLCTADAKLDK